MDDEMAVPSAGVMWNLSGRMRLPDRVKTGGGSHEPPPATVGIPLETYLPLAITLIVSVPVYVAPPV